MRIVIQRVKKASVDIEGRRKSEIGNGLLVLLGIEEADEKEDADWLVRKLTGMRIFSDSEGHMNLSVSDVAGEVLVVSQFTLHASTRKGNRPSFIRSAKPAKAESLYEYFVKSCEEAIPYKIATGEFGADMQVMLINDGPVTLLVDSKNRE